MIALNILLGTSLRHAGRWAAIGLASALGSVLAGCAPYHKLLDPGRDDQSAVEFVLQADDVGKFWNPKMAQDALDEIERHASTTNTIVVVFVHGWHHNADSNNENLVDFRRSMVLLREQLDKPLYAESRRLLTGIDKVRVVGVYMGWRGRALPGLLDYATFWGRKAAAERVGEGDFREFMLQLQAVYKKYNPHIGLQGWEEVKAGRRTAPFMGLASIGHSFGGQVLFRATHSVLEANLIAAGASPTFGEPTTLSKPTAPVEGFGDIVVLINPALEALQYDRIDRLSRSLAYDPIQPPLMFVMSAATDSARSVLFPLGRAVNALWRATLRPDVRAMWGRALGSYRPQQTHEVVIVGDPGKDWNFDPEESYQKDPCSVIRADLTGSPSFLTGKTDVSGKSVQEGVMLKRLKEDAQPYTPFVVANVPVPDKGALALIDGHSGIWKSVLSTFTTNYVALAEGKRILIARDAHKTCPPAPDVH
jgi:hypothetical protein